MFYDTALDCHVVSPVDTGLATSVSGRLTTILHVLSLSLSCHRPACEDSMSAVYNSFVDIIYNSFVDIWFAGCPSEQVELGVAPMEFGTCAPAVKSFLLLPPKRYQFSSL